MDLPKLAAASETGQGHAGHRDAATRAAAPASASAAGIGEATQLLRRLFRGFDGSLAVRLWDGHTLRLGQRGLATGIPAFTLVCHSPQAICAVVLGRDRLRLAEVYFGGGIDIEGDFFAALHLKDHLDALRMSWRDRLGVLLPALRLQRIGRALARGTARQATLTGRAVKAHSRSENRDAVGFHYDVSNAFYALWLDAAMVYSCAYFERADDTLEQAQRAKLEHICRKLQLSPGDRFLDIGCGWGALMIHAARHHGVRAHGVTLSQRQFALAEERIRQAGVADRVTVELRDYRDLQGEAVYDKIASVGMFEHVGLRNLPIYFATVQRLLKPSGLFLNHGITHYREGWDKKTLSTEFINRYIFPDGELDTVSHIQRGMERAGFEIADVEALRPHYALTLRHWVARLEQHHDAALQYVSESTYRVWRLYMAACALEFESADIGVYQMLASKGLAGAATLPLTRRHLYLPQEEAL